MLKEFREAVAKAGGCRGFARQGGIHHSVVADAVRTEVVGPRLIAALGLTRIVTYARVQP